MAHDKNTPKEESQKIEDEKPTEHVSPKPDVPTTPTAELTKSRFAFFKTKKGKITLSAIGAVVAILIILFAVPMTRYAILGTFIKKDVTVRIIDSITKKAVTEAQVSVAGQTGKTDTDGKVLLHNIPVGPQTFKATKKYYKDFSQSVHVTTLSAPGLIEFTMEATGRQVLVTVINKVGDTPIKNALVSALEATTTTNDIGQATIVLPADKDAVPGKVTAPGFNDTAVIIAVTAQPDPKNTFAITPTGKLYFLSKRTGKIDVMKSDLDGANAQVVLAGTGKEDNYETSLLASRDWKYLMLKAKRDSDLPKLYLIDTTNGDKTAVMDEGNADFEPIGWFNEYFMYHVARANVQAWQAKAEAIKSFNAKTGALTNLDETAAEGTNTFDFAHENLDNTYILNGHLIYAKQWYASVYSPARLNDKKMNVMSVEPSGANKTSLKDFAEGGNNFMSARLYEPQELYFQVTIGTSTTYHTFKDGKVSQSATANADTFNKEYPTFLISPSGKATYWTEARDGKNTQIIGDANAENATITSFSDAYKSYGWYTDNYVLMSKNGSELYIEPVPMTQVVGTDAAHVLQPLKVTNYHKAGPSFIGYGYGYGGL